MNFNEHQTQGIHINSQQPTLFTNNTSRTTDPPLLDFRNLGPRTVFPESNEHRISGVTATGGNNLAAAFSRIQSQNTNTSMPVRRDRVRGSFPTTTQSSNSNNNNNNNNNNGTVGSTASNIISGIRLSMALNMANLDRDDLAKIQVFQNALQTKVESFLVAVEKKRHLLLHEIEADNMKLRRAQLTDNPQTSAIFAKLQKIRLRAIETETVELQRLRLRILGIVDEYKRAISEYSKAKAEGRAVANPTDGFYHWINDTLDLSENSNLTTGLQELAEYSRQLVSNLESPSGALFQSKNSIVDSFASLIPLNFSSNTSSSTTPYRKSRGVFPLHRLPSEILHLVLDKLSSKRDIVNLMTVCKLWALIIVKILYYRPYINKKEQLELFLRTMQLPATKTVFDYRLMIKRLNFSFVGDYIYDKDLYNFVGCRNLERLTLVFCKNITSDPVSAVLENCTHLQSVDITGIKDVQDNVFNTLAQSCPRVQGFYVPIAKSVSFNALHNFITHAPMLKRVKITSNNNINDELVELLADLCPMLVEVDITGSPNVHNESLIKLFLKLNQLREFRITYNSNITDKFFLELSRNVDALPALRLVDFSSCENITDKTIEHMVNLAPKLRNVFLGKCSRITDNSLFHLARLGKNLQTVHFGHCFNITDQGVRVLVQSCPRIQYVDFACCTNLTNRTLYELSDLTKLKRIGLVKCSQMTDEGLLNMVSLRGRNDSLERVHLSYCSNLTIYPIYELLMACPRLSHLSLTAVPSFLRPDITAFCRSAPSDFSENQRQIFCVFSGKGVHKLRHYLMSLTTPTDGPRTDINEIFTKYIITNNMLFSSEDLESGIERISNELNQDSAAILAATGINQLPGLNNDMNFQSIRFEQLGEMFSFLKGDYNNFQMDSDELNHLMSLVDRKFCDDPFNGDYDDINGVVVPLGDSNLNDDMCHIVRKFHELDERVDDFEVNVASLARIQFQFTGFLLHEMAQIYVQMVELNRQICQTQEMTLATGIQKDIKGLYVWRILFAGKFAKLLQKYKISTVVLRLYLKDSITLLTRQREIALAHQRETWSNITTEEPITAVNSRADPRPVTPVNDDSINVIEESNDDDVEGVGILGNQSRNFENAELSDTVFWPQLRDRPPLTADQVRLMQLGAGEAAMAAGNRAGRGDEEVTDVHMDSRSQSSGTDTALHGDL